MLPLHFHIDTSETHLVEFHFPFVLFVFKNTDIFLYFELID